MNRRNFIKFGLATLSAAALPVAGAAPIPTGRSG